MYRPFLFSEDSPRSMSSSPRERVRAKTSPAPTISPRLELKHDINLKIVVVGAEKVGKTTLIRQYMGMRISTWYTPTIGPSVISKYMPLDSLQSHIESKDRLPDGLSYDRVKVDFWEVPHQELYGQNIERVISKANGFVFVFDSSEPSTFGAVNEWFSAIKAFKRGESGHVRSESPSVVPSPPIMPVKSGQGISSTIEYGKACSFSVPSVLFAHKSDIKKSTVEGDSLLSGMDKYCSEYGALFWAKTSSYDGSVPKYAFDTFVNSVLDNYLRREELRIVMASERLKMRRPKIKMIVQKENDESVKEQEMESPKERYDSRKAVLLKAEKLQKSVKEYHNSGKDIIRNSSLLDDEKKALLDKFDDEFTKMEAAVSTLVISAASNASGGGNGSTGGILIQRPGGDDELGKVVNRVESVFDKKKIKWNDIFSEKIK